MLTDEQKKWIDSLSDGVVTIVPYDIRTEELLEKVSKKYRGF